MKLKIGFIVILIIVLNTAKAQKLFIDTAKQNSINDSNGLYNFAWSPGYLNIQPGNFVIFNARKSYIGGNETQPLTVFRLDTITGREFIKIKKKYKTHINKDSSKVKWTDTSFVIKFDKTERIFTANQNDYSFFEYYLGLLEPLNLYIVHGVDGDNEVGWMELIDKKTGKSYGFGSPSDYPIEALRISPKRTYLLGYVNDLYDDHSFISILKINTQKNTFTLSDFYGINIAGTYIKELVWIDEQSFAIAADDRYTDENTSVGKYFLKISFGK